MKKYLLLSFMLLLTVIYSDSWAQQRTISGKITSVEDGSSLPGVNVVLKGTSAGTVSDIDGNYSLSVPTAGGTLVFSFVGLQTEEVEVGTRSVIDVRMSADVKQLSEVIVTAFGIEKEERSLGYAVSTLESDEVLKAREVNIANALTGKVAGVDVTASGGTVGASSRIVIRGAASISGNNQPLYVIDGIPISNSNEESNSLDRFSGVDYGNRGGDINPDDIESMSVLKGAAAAALYGQRAANGVIVITTKRGKKNQKTSVSVNSSIRFDRAFRLPDYQNAYGQGNFSKLDSAETQSWGPALDGRAFVAPDGSTQIYQAFPDNVEDFYETGKTVINSVSLAGGGEKSTYRFGVTALDQEGIVPNTNLKRLTFNMNASREFGNKFYSNFGMNYVRTRNDGRPETGFNNQNAVASIVHDLPRNTDINSLRDYLNPDGTPKLFLGLNQNPFFSLFENVFTQELDRIFGYGQVGYKPVDWINISWKLGADVYRDKRKQINVPGSVGASGGQFWSDRIFESQINSDLLITINRDITEGLNANLTVGHNVNEIFIESAFDRGQELVDPTLFIPDNATVNTPSDEILNHRRIYGVFFDLGLSYNNYLFLNVTGRNDWNSTLPEDNQSFFYPAVSASAVLSEIFDVQSNVLSFAKLRASWGQVGAGTDPYQLEFTFLPQTDIFQLFGVDNSYPFNGIPGFAGTNRIPNPTLKPEITTSWELGFELQFLKSRIILDATYYNAKSDDQIIPVTVAPATGFSQQLLNAGTVVNKGVEIRLEAIPLQLGDFQWRSTLNFARNDNELEELIDPYEFVDIPGTRTDPSLRAFVGQSLGTIFGSAWRRDAEGNILINPDNGLRLEEEGVELGNIVPDFRLGFQNEFSYKGVSLSALIDWKQGGDIHSQTVQNLRATGVAEETGGGRDVGYIDNGVILLDEDADGNAISTRPNDIVITAEQFWAQQDNEDEDGIFDGTYVKLREVRIGYTIPQSLIEKTPFGSIQVGFEARNLALLYSKIPHIDPEVSFYGPTNTQGIEAFNLPTTRSYGFNVRFTF